MISSETRLIKQKKIQHWILHPGQVASLNMAIVFSVRGFTSCTYLGSIASHLIIPTFSHNNQRASIPFRAINCLFSIQLQSSATILPADVVRAVYGVHALERITHTHTHKRTQAPKRNQETTATLTTLNLHISTPCCITLSSWITTSSEVNRMYLCRWFGFVCVCVRAPSHDGWDYCCRNVLLLLLPVITFASENVLHICFGGVHKPALVYLLSISIRVLRRRAHPTRIVSAFPKRRTLNMRCDACLFTIHTQPHTYDQIKLFVFYAKWVQIQFNYI